MQGGGERSTAESGGSLAAFGVTEELVPLGVWGKAVFLGRPLGATTR